MTLSPKSFAVRLLLAVAAGIAGHAARGESSLEAAGPVPAAAAHDGYELQWSDEFAIDGPPSAANWVFENGFCRNQEAQWYQPENARCEGGLLVIEARRERVEIEPAVRWANRYEWARERPQAEYTSASLNTRGKHAWLYGRFVMRARVPVAQGAWPAFWTVGQGRWPDSGEIDIMEVYRGDVLANVAWLGPKRKAHWDAVKTPIAELGGEGWGDAFHEFRMDWDEHAIKLYVDNRLLNTTDLSETINADGSGRNPFHEPQFLWVNLAIGGVHGGDPSQTSFPLRYEIDYVRVYQRPKPIASPSLSSGPVSVR